MFFLFGFGRIIYVFVLALNAITILSEDRFLGRIGWARNPTYQTDPGFGQTNDPNSLGSRARSLLHSIRLVARVPLIFLNVGIIVYELILG